MKKIWKFIQDPKNLAVLTALGGLLGFLWNQTTFINWQFGTPVKMSELALPTKPSNDNNKSELQPSINQLAISKNPNAPATNIANGNNNKITIKY
ncbi:hypothetical protein [Rivihabitans pingtungensis]|uniref:hypothetical protein n=1 Tax=Rivihabitans pingtungensis TaxID=1054498 RepID=UPI0023536130|nr:hypothetical protein [Rivihabitans pingtungensis]MCK6437788.1 hypothetical protein [Rivihabitans pingtungensis]